MIESIFLAYPLGDEDRSERVEAFHAHTQRCDEYSVNEIGKLGFDKEIKSGKERAYIVYSI